MAEATVCAILYKDGKFLLVKRKYEPFRNKWALPSGLIAEYELADSAAKYAVKTETGLDLKPKFFKYYDEVFRAERCHSVIMVFCGEFKGNLEPNKMIGETSWFSLDEIKRIHLASLHKQIIEDFSKHEQDRKNNKPN